MSSSLNKKFCLISAILKRLSKVIWSLSVPKDSSLSQTIVFKYQGGFHPVCGQNTANKVTQRGHRSTLRLKAMSFMWVTCPARFSGRRQRGTMVRLGSCWQTIPGPRAISSCFLSTQAFAEVDCTSLFFFYKADMKDRAVYVCLLWLGFVIGTLREGIKVLLCVWCWTRVVSNAGISWLL